MQNRFPSKKLCEEVQLLALVVYCRLFSRRNVTVSEKQNGFQERKNMIHRFTLTNQQQSQKLNLKCFCCFLIMAFMGF